MALRDPVAGYNAATNLEAHLICGLLRDAGIEAATVEDVSMVGHWIGGLMPEIHKPQVWIERADMERAKPILDAYEQRPSQQAKSTSDTWPIGVTCEECGKRSLFPAEQNGTVQECPHCRAYVDVGDESWGDWAEIDESE
jgi:hypothetical protein